MNEHELDDMRPWEPRVWRVGDRVRVNVSPECPCWSAASKGVTRGSLNGMTGTIYDPATKDWTCTYPNHQIAVDFDTWIWVGASALSKGLFATSELEPLDEPDAP